MKDLEQKIIELGHSQTYKKDEFLFHADDPAEGFYYLQSGEIRVYKMDEQGKEVEVVRPNPGDFFGEAIVFVQKKYPSYAKAVKDSQVVFFEKNSFSRIFYLYHPNRTRAEKPLSYQFHLQQILT